ncbi:MAG: hypothetical protein P8P74_15145 [Crocinitomicaceae bacterium]|nr:hypothetical protein [Crocinitomicaceae bacterium]
MRRLFIALLSTFMLSSAFAQNIDGTELGIDGYFGASTNGGNISIGAKYGFKFQENFIAGPSLRFQRNWNNNPISGFESSYNVFGAGAFVHARYGNVLFGGLEFEMMRTPFATTFTTTNGPTWSPALFIGGGYSQEFNEKFRINAGIMYDVINHVNSPFRQGYFIRKSGPQGQAGQFIPLIYRITFFFVLT